MKINIVFYQPEIPGNTGNIMRTSLATKSKFHIIKPISFDLDSPKMKRFCANYEREQMELEVHESYDDFVNKYGDKIIFYITRYGLKLYSDIDFVEQAKLNNDEIWIMFGTESTGIPKKILQQDLNRTLRIPMNKNVRSLNLSNSTNIIVYEILRQFKFKNLSLHETQKGADWILKND